VLARGVDLAQVHLGHAIAEVAQNQVGLGHGGIDLSDVREVQAQPNEGTPSEPAARRADSSRRATSLSQNHGDAHCLGGMKLSGRLL
jgi:O-acetyl-ADP-ribose deacetylase (regulator of RNase III)